MTIRNALFSLVLLAVIPAFLLIVFSAVELHQSETRRIEQDMARLTQNLAIHQENIATSTRQLLQTLALVPEVIARDREHCCTLFATLLKQNPHFADILAADPQGEVFADGRHFQPFSVADRKYFRDALQTRSFAVGEFIISRSSAKPVLTFALPVYNANGNLQVVLLASYQLSHYDEIFNAARLENATLVMSDHLGKVLHRSTDAGKYIGQQDILFPQMEQRVRGQFKARGLDGTLRHYSFTSLRIAPESPPYLYLRVGADDRMTFDMVYRRLFRDLAIVLAGAVGTILLALFYGNRRIAAPISTLTDSARLIADGNAPHLDAAAAGVREISDLAQAFNLMGRTLAQREAENKELLAELRQSEEHYRVVADFTLSWEYWLRNDSSIAYMSPSAKEITGYGREEFLANPELLIDVVHPDDRPLILQHRQHFELHPAEGMTSLDLRIVTRAGEVRWLNHVCQPVYDSNGNIMGRRAGNRDISDRKAAEQKLLQLNMELEERVQERTREYQAINRELESFCYSVSHDLRAPLRHVNSFSTILLEDFGPELTADAQHHLSRIAAAAGHMGELIDGLLNLSRLSRGALHRRPVNLSQLVADKLSNLRQQHPERQVITEIMPDVIVQGDSTLLQALVDNLVGNAWKFTAKTLGARIEFGCISEERGMVCHLLDNGVGFDMNYVDKLFQPFQRLHRADEFEGTGIGLATVQRIINRHGGTIWAESTPNERTAFYFILP